MSVLQCVCWRTVEELSTTHFGRGGVIGRSVDTPHGNVVDPLRFARRGKRLGTTLCPVVGLCS